ncbi:hypothetical protein AVEN_109318-1 [Araneus ventricosus]|uniref:Uncharacterized protein n=1 Tax=Araneus ventricosus TaxID=182803 RepID=A0A4Y2D1F0_ARAVE|nr:hypothetical protein AVEN_109318-1 [Araneus ventricosus]
MDYSLTFRYRIAILSQYGAFCLPHANSSQHQIYFYLELPEAATLSNRSGALRTPHPITSKELRSPEALEIDWSSLLRRMETIYYLGKHRVENLALSYHHV